MTTSHHWPSYPIIPIIPIITHTPLVAGNFPIKPLVARQWPTTKYYNYILVVISSGASTGYRTEHGGRSDVLPCDSYTEVLVVIAGLLVGRVKHVDLEAIPLATKGC